MKKTVIVNILLLLAINLLVKPVWIFGIDRVVQNQVGEVNYGWYYALFNFSFLFSIVLDLGITNFNSKNIAQHRHQLGEQFSWMMSTKLLLSLAYFGLAFIGALAMGYDTVGWGLLLWLLINQFLASLILYLRSNLSGLLLFGQDRLLSVLDRLIMIAIVGYLLYGPSHEPIHIKSFVMSQTVAYLLTAIVAFVLVLKQAKKITIRLEYKTSLQVLRKSLPYALLILLMTMYSRVDAIMLERMLDDGKFFAGVYAQGYRFLDALNNIAYLFAIILLPTFARMAAEQKSPAKIIEAAQNMLVPSAIAVALAAGFYREEVCELLYTQPHQQSGTVFGMLMIGFVAVAFNYIYGTLLTANDKIKQLNQMAVAALILNVCLNGLFIPSLQASGAALATLITQFFTVGVHAYLVKRNKLYAFRPRQMLRFFLFTFLFLGIGWFVYFQLNLSLLIELVFISVSFVSLAWMFKFITITQIKSLLQNKSF